MSVKVYVGDCTENHAKGYSKTLDEGAGVVGAGFEYLWVLSRGDR